MVVVVHVESEANRSRRLQRCRCADGQEVVHLADGAGFVRRRDRIAEPPASAAERLRKTGDRDRALAHAGKGRKQVVLSRIQDVLVDLIGERPDVVLNAQVGDEGQLLAREDVARRIVRRVHDDRAGLRRERRAQPIRVELPVGGLQRHEHRLRAGENCIRAIVLVPRLEDDDLVVRVDQREEDRGHRFGGAARYRELPVGLELDAVHLFVFGRDRFAQHGSAPRDCVLIDVLIDGSTSGILHRLRHGKVREALRQVDRAGLHRDARHLADHGLRKRSSTNSGHACGCWSEENSTV